MPDKLRRTGETRTLTFEVFDLELDDTDRQHLAADPRGFLNNLLQEEGQQVNGLLVDDDEKFQAPNDSGAVGLTTTVWHCTAPPNKVSRWITIVSGAADDDGDGDR
jgi:hypothetical protein